MPRSPGIISSVNSCVSLACALRNGTTRGVCCFLPPIKGHVDRLRLLLVLCSTNAFRKDDEHGGREGGRGLGEREKEREAEKEKEKEHAHKP